MSLRENPGLFICGLAGLAVLISATYGDAQWLGYKTPGIPRTADGKPDLAAPAPRMADGKPDFSGVWRTDLERTADAKTVETAKLQPWAEAVAKKRSEDLRRDSPEVLCLPMGPSPDLGFGKVVQTPGLLLMLYDGTLFRQIFLDGRELPKDPNPDWMGYSIGYWDGDMLIVESNGFNDRSWLRGDGAPHTEQLHVTERIRRPDFGHMEVRTTYVDPGALLAPWNVTAKYLLDDIQPLEYVYNENERDRTHLIGKASDLQSVILEPDLLAEYAGTYEYRNPESPQSLTVYIFTVTADGQLTLSIGASSYSLTTLSRTVFATTNGVPFEFFRSDDGTVSWVFAQMPEGDIKAVRRK
jgi:hypothetical protein